MQRRLLSREPRAATGHEARGLLSNPGGLRRPELWFAGFQLAQRFGYLDPSPGGGEHERDGLMRTAQCETQRCPSPERVGHDRETAPPEVPDVVVGRRTRLGHSASAKRRIPADLGRRT
jgi:hypothetical protein